MGFDKRPLIGITTDISGEYLLLKQHYIPAVLRAGGTPVLIGGCDFGVCEPSAASGCAAFYTEKIDGLLIPGGDDLDPALYGESPLYEMKPANRERSVFEINLIHEIMEKGKPVLGICYGMQLINVALGGSLYQDIDSDLKGALDHRKDHEVEITGGPLKRGRSMVNSTHHQAVKQLGRGLEAIARADDGVIEAVFMGDYPFLLGVQWHPERLESGLSSEIFSLFTEAANAGK